MSGLVKTLPELYAAGRHAELMTMWDVTRRATRREAAAIIGDRRSGFTLFAARYGNIACNLAVSIHCANRGDDMGAALYAFAAELSRREVPTDLLARWGMTEPLYVGPTPEPKPIGHPHNPNR